jgi:hypothetical protein
MVSRLVRVPLMLMVGLVLMFVPATGQHASLALAAGSAPQEIPESPGLAETVFQSGLTGPDLFEARACPTGAASGQYVVEGFRLSVRGRCVQDAPSANLPLPAPRITMLDNDVAVDFKVVAGANRAGLNVYARVRDSGNLMVAYLNFGGDKAELIRRDANVNRTLTGYVGLKELIDPTDWNRVSLRLRGKEAWLLLNDEPILYSGDVVDQVGGIGIGLVREGNVNDTSEVAIVFRDLALSTLADPEQP